MGGRSSLPEQRALPPTREGIRRFRVFSYQKKEAIVKRTVNSGSSGAILSKAGSRQSQGWGTTRLEEGGRGVGFLLPSLLIRPRTNERSPRTPPPFFQPSLRGIPISGTVRAERGEGSGPTRTNPRTTVAQREIRQRVRGVFFATFSRRYIKR